MCRPLSSVRSLAPACVGIAVGTAVIPVGITTAEDATGTGAPRVSGATMTVSLPRLTLTFTSPRSSSNSAMSFSTRNSISSFSSLWFMPVLDYLDCDQLLSCRCENLASSISHQDHIFDPDPADAWDVNTGFYSYYHARLQLLVLPTGDARSLMNLQPHTVTGGMRKVLPNSAPVQNAAGGAIYSRHRNSRTNLFDCRLLRKQNSVIHAAPTRIHFADVHGAGH